MPDGCTSATDPLANVQCSASGHAQCPEMEGVQWCQGTITSAKLFANAARAIGPSALSKCNTSQGAAKRRGAWKRRGMEEEVEDGVGGSTLL